MRKMIHLVWQKDNDAPPSTTGEELVSAKGVHKKLFDAYDSIYFSPHENVPQHAYASTIARQMIECAFFAIVIRCRCTLIVHDLDSQTRCRSPN